MPPIGLSVQAQSRTLLPNDDINTADLKDSYSGENSSSQLSTNNRYLVFTSEYLSIQPMQQETNKRPFPFSLFQ